VRERVRKTEGPQVMHFIDFLKGELENWWEPQTDDRFKERAQCIIDQVILSLFFVKWHLYVISFGPWSILPKGKSYVCENKIVSLSFCLSNFL
jgi:hypothetical protein